MTVAVAILMKDLSDAKSRLGNILPSAEREALALSLFENMLAFFARFHADKPLCVVTPSSRIAEIALRHNAEYLRDHDEGTINHAAGLASLWAVQHKSTSLLIMHADIPVVSETEIADLIAVGGATPVVIVESEDGGTNALMVTPPDAISFHYGPLSASRHQRAAETRGLPYARLKFAHLSNDLDNAADLAKFEFLFRHRTS